MYENGELKWQQYLSANKPWLLEVIPAKLYSTEFYHSEVTTELRFFTRLGTHRAHSNIVIAGMLPNPQAFLIEHIRIDGISNNIKYGACVLQIGAKHYGYAPAWTYALKEKGFRLIPKIFIPSLCNFCFEITWEKAEKIGPGLSGEPIKVRPIQVVFYGQLARSVN